VLAAAVATGVRRGARVVVAAPAEGPLRDAAGGRAAVLAPRLPVPDEFALSRYLAAGLATLHAVDPAIRVDLAALADELDHEALRNSAAREVFTNAAKALAQRLSDGGVVLAGDSSATLALARHLSAILLRVGHRVVAAAGLPDAWWRCTPVPASAAASATSTPCSTTSRSTARCPTGCGWWS
jgi:hypothetical protein